MKYFHYCLIRQDDRVLLEKKNQNQTKTKQRVHEKQTNISNFLKQEYLN